MSDLTNPLEAILKAASQANPKEEYKSAAYKSERRKDSNYLSNFSVQLIDISASMNEKVEGGQTKIEIVKSILVNLPYCPNNIGFNSEVKRLDISRRLKGSGSTNLALGLQYCANYSPDKILIISDGQPDSKPAALEAAQELDCKISCFFVGKDDDHSAKEFMRNLAQEYHGKYTDCDISVLEDRKELPQKIQYLLPGGES